MSLRYRGLARNDVEWYVVEAQADDGQWHTLDPGPSLTVFNHSPDGFAWSYLGSGPAQLALALLLDRGLAAERAVRLHQRFKEQYVARWPESGWELTATEIDGWITAQNAWDARG